MKKLAKTIIKFYQKYISVFSHGSCRYYPTCSEYAIWQLETNSFFKAIYFTITRLLRCNPLFVGGIDYPTVRLKSKSEILYKKIKVRYWYVPIDKEKFVVIKNRDWNSKG